MSWKQSTLPSPTGAALCLYSSLPKGKPKAILQINHDMAEHAARYERFAKALNEAGYGVFAHDHRGHGATVAQDAPLGIFAAKNGLEAVLSDIDAVNQHIRQDHPQVPIICFGHSMGSILGLNYALRNSSNIDGVALWNAGVETGALALVYGLILKTQRIFKGSDVPSGIAAKLTFETWNKEFAPNRTPSDWLSRDEAEVDKYVADPLCGFDVSIGLWLDLLGAIYYGADDANLARLPRDMPVHLLAGDKDPCTEKGQSVRNLADRMQRIGLSDVKLTVLSDTRHESLNETNREETTRDFIAWLDKHWA